MTLLSILCIKRRSLFYTFLVPIVLASCGKKFDEVPNTSKLIDPYVNCKITKETYKTLNKFSVVDREDVYVGNKPYSVSIEYVKKYLYNEHGKIIQEKEFSYNNYDSTITDYLYSNKQIIQKRSIYKDINVSVTQDTFILNNKGLIETNADLMYFFDADDYLTQIINTKVDYYKNNKILSANNFIKESTTFGEGTDNKLNEYNILKVNIPSYKPFYGRQSYNLISKTIINVSNSVSIINGDKYKLTYSYVFDNKDRVSRQIRLGEAISQGWPFIFDSGEIGITDFEYDCK